MENTETLGARLRRLRLERRMSQKTLAHPYTASLVSQIENERKVPSTQVLTLFAKKLRITPEELAHGEPAATEAEIVSRLQEGWQRLYSGIFESAHAAFKEAIHLSKLVGDASLEAEALAGLARCRERRGQNDDAMHLYEEALGLLREHAAPPAAAEAVCGIARCHQTRGDTRLALHVLESYLLELQTQHLSDPRALMRVYASLVWPCTELGLNERANDVAANALRLQASVEEPEEIARMHLNAARALLNSGRSGDALTSLRLAEEIFRNLSWHTEIARAQTNKGIVLMNQGDLPAAQEALEAAAALFRSVGFTKSEARNLNELARLARLSLEWDRSEALARRALELLEEMEAVPELALAHRELGLALARRDSHASEQHLRHAAHLYESCGELDHAADTYRLVGDLRNAAEEGSGAEDYRAGLLLLARRLDRSDEL